MEPEEFLMIRKRLKLTQTQIANDLGVSLRTIKYYESGQVDVSITVQKLLKYMARDKGIYY